MVDVCGRPIHMPRMRHKLKLPLQSLCTLSIAQRIELNDQRNKYYKFGHSWREYTLNSQATGIQEMVNSTCCSSLPFIVYRNLEINNIVVSNGVIRAPVKTSNLKIEMFFFFSFEFNTFGNLSYFQWKKKYDSLKTHRSYDY